MPSDNKGLSFVRDPNVTQWSSHSKVAQLYCRLARSEFLGLILNIWFAFSRVISRDKSTSNGNIYSAARKLFEYIDVRVQKMENQKQAPNFFFCNNYQQQLSGS